MVFHKKYILASSSKSRQFILKKIGFNSTQLKPLCDEEKIKRTLKKNNLSPITFAKKLSFEKAKSISVLKKYSKKNVIGCDTVIFLNNRIIDKAKNMNEARKKIKKLSGKTHEITSAITICRNGKKIWQCSVTTKVKIRKLSEKEIKIYLKLVGKQILQSVGCYQIESTGPRIIEEIRGDFFNVMGLPLFKLLKYVYSR